VCHYSLSLGRYDASGLGSCPSSRSDIQLVTALWPMTCTMTRASSTVMDPFRCSVDGSRVVYYSKITENELIKFGVGPLGGRKKGWTRIWNRAGAAKTILFWSWHS
jgi:hypothetical protein